MKKACEAHRPGREKQQAPGYLSQGKTEQLQRWHSCWASLWPMATGLGWLAQRLPEALLPSASRIQLGCLIHPFRLSQNQPALKNGFQGDFTCLDMALCRTAEIIIAVPTLLRGDCAGFQASPGMWAPYAEWLGFGDALSWNRWSQWEVCRKELLKESVKGGRGSFPYLIFHLSGT